MIEESEALARILDEVPVGISDEQPLNSAVGRYAAAEYKARVPLPGFDNSAMDGYAVRAEDCATPGTVLRVTGEQPAGADLGLVVREGEAIRIFTGAPIPDGSDAVVMQEDTERVEDQEKPVVRILDPPKRGEFIRRKGCDTCSGQKIIGKGERVTPQMVGLLASQGYPGLRIGVPPKLGILTTGDELVPPGYELEPGQIYNSNGAMLEALAASAGVERIRQSHVEDEPAAVRNAVGSMLEENDFLLISGGVSVGDHDHVKAVLADIGVSADFWRVRVKPGKPFLFGKFVSGERKAFVFGLPGNPVSSFVTFLAFVRPAIAKWMGAGDRWQRMPTQIAEAGEELYNPGNRPHYLRGTLDGDGRFYPTGMQQSHALGALARADAIVRLDAEERVSRGGRVRAFKW